MAAKIITKIRKTVRAILDLNGQHREEGIELFYLLLKLN
jgi:hypothetical protein